MSLVDTVYFGIYATVFP